MQIDLSVLDAPLPEFRGIAPDLWARRNVPSLGYEPLFISLGWNPTFARMLANLLVGSGRRREREQKSLPTFARAVKTLAKGSEIPIKETRRAAQELLTIRQDTSIVETIFKNTGMSDLAFLRLLEKLVEGQVCVLTDAAVVAVKLLDHLPQTRGRRVSAATFSHELLMKEPSLFLGRPARYTWSAIDEQFTDCLTEATRKEFRLRKFDPRPALARLHVKPN